MKKLLYSTLIGLVCFQNIGFAMENPAQNTQQAPAAGSTQASTPDKFMLYPVDPNTVNPHFLIYEMKPGEEFTEKMFLKNFTPEEKNFTLYVTDRLVEQNGDHKVIVFKNDNEEREMPKWITVTPDKTAVKSQDEVPVTVHIKIPADAKMGDYEGGIAVVKIEPSKTMKNISIAVRYVIDVRIKVTDNPQHIERYSEVKSGPTLYFYLSILLFGGSVGYYFFATHKEKKRKKGSGQK